MTPHDRTPLILFSGLAADANVFSPQSVAFPQLIVPPWPVPLPTETLDSYSKRLANELRPHSPVFMGGASFGGIIALHVVKHLDLQGVLLIGSVRSPAGFPGYVRIARPFQPLLRFVPVRLLQLLCLPLISSVVQRMAPHLSGLARQFCDSDPRVFKWSLARLLDWKSTPEITCPVFCIHGDRDFVLPLRYQSADTVVTGGGHVISLTHAKQVNDFIRETLASGN